MASVHGARWRHVLGYALAALTVFFLARHVGLNASSFVDVVRDIAPSALVVAALAFALHLFVNALAFCALNHALGVVLPTSVLSSAWAGTLLTKYVPGGIWHIVGRGLLLSRYGVGPKVTTAVGLLEQMISLAVCVLLAAALLWGAGVAPWWVPVAGLTAAMAMVWLSRKVFLQINVPVDLRFLRNAMIAYTLAMGPYAVGYMMIASPEMPTRFLGALFGGTVAGVLALPVPGGLGVREAATSLLSASDQPARLVAALLAARVVILVVEFTVGVASMLILRRRGLP